MADETPTTDETGEHFVGLPLLMDQLPGKLQMAERDQEALEAVMLALEVQHVPTPAASGGSITMGPTSLAGEILELLDRHGWVLVRAEELGTTLPEEEPTDEQRSEGLMRASQLADRDHGAPSTDDVLEAAERFARFLQNGHRIPILPPLVIPADEAGQERLGEELATELADRLTTAADGSFAGLEGAVVVLKAAQPQLRVETDNARSRAALAEPF